MIKILFLVIVALHECNSQSSPPIKWIYMGCNSSGITVANLTCRLKSMSRTHQIIKLGFEIIKEIRNLNVIRFMKELNTKITNLILFHIARPSLLP